MPAEQQKAHPRPAKLGTFFRRSKQRRLSTRSTWASCTRVPSAQDEERILEFLVHDSRVRKLERRDEFQAEQEKLKAQFEEALKL